MFKILHYSLNWPFTELFSTGTCLYVIYLIRKHFSNHYLKLLSSYQNYLIDSNRKNKEFCQLKRNLFNDLNLLLKQKHSSISSISFLEIGIGCGDNFDYYPNGKLIF
jgi:hypothetical protein